MIFQIKSLSGYNSYSHYIGTFSHKYDKYF